MTSLIYQPNDWQVLDLGEDPVPGDADAIEALAQQLTTRAESLDTASQELAGANTADIWQGNAGNACTETVDRTSSRLSELAQSGQECTQALTNWADELRRAQHESRLALEDGRDAQHRLEVAEAALGRPDDNPRPDVDGPVTLPAPVGGGVHTLEASIPAVEPDGSSEHWARQAEEARADLETAKRRVADAVAARDDAASIAARRIEDAIPTPQVHALNAAVSG